MSNLIVLRFDYDATCEGTNLRLRPIVMARFAFMLGRVPLAVGEAGKENH
jgi:multidrug efflux pump subunit AcrB